MTRNFIHLKVLHQPPQAHCLQSHITLGLPHTIQHIMTTSVYSTYHMFYSLLFLLNIILLGFTKSFVCVYVGALFKMGAVMGTVFACFDCCCTY